MHEMSIAMNIIEILREELARQPGQKLREVRLSIGELSGIEADSLRFFLEAAFAEEHWKNVEIVTTRAPLEAECKKCGHTFAPEETDYRCDACDSAELSIVGGQSLHIQSIVIE